MAEAERVTSAEIRVHLDHRCPGDAMARAIALFERLGMHAHRLRNGVLIYVAVQDRKLAVIGDTRHPRAGRRGVLAAVSSTDDRRTCAPPARGTACVAAVREVGEALRGSLPARVDDRNELSDEVSFS